MLNRQDAEKLIDAYKSALLEWHNSTPTNGTLGERYDRALEARKALINALTGSSKPNASVFNVGFLAAPEEG